jgi:hypothetical protein
MQKQVHLPDQSEILQRVALVHDLAAREQRAREAGDRRVVVVRKLP